MKAIDQAHRWIAACAVQGDTVIDATMGKGRDTLRLCQIVGAAGRVYAFDIQLQALAATRALLARHPLTQNCRLVLADHSMMHMHVPPQLHGTVSGIMFNLGYLPGGDTALVTLVPTTLLALVRSLEILRVGGRLSIVCYPGHREGELECQAIEQWLGTLCAQQYQVEYGAYAADRQATPRFFGIEKRGARDAIQVGLTY